MNFDEAYDAADGEGYRVGVEKMVHSDDKPRLRFTVTRGMTEMFGEWVDSVSDLNVSAGPVIDQIRKAPS